MRRFVCSSIVLVALVGAVGCGDDDTPSDTSEAVTPPENPERDLPTVGAPQDDDHEAPPPQEEYEREDRVSNGDTEGECCPATFAFAPRYPEQVQDAVLRGSLYPMNTADGVALQETDGVWSGEACLAPDEFGTYHYELSLRTASSDEPFLSDAYNQYAPTTTTAGELVNAWIPADDCASMDVSVHAQTSE